MELKLLQPGLKQAKLKQSKLKQPRLTLPTLALLLAGAGMLAAHAQAPAVPDTGTVDAKVLAELDRMGTHLRSLKQYTVRADATAEMVMADGEKLMFPGSVDYKVMSPTGLYANLKTDRKQREYYYDGKTLTVYSPRQKYYSQVAASGSIRELVTMAADDYGLEMPLADLFLWGTPDAHKGDITSAIYVGPATVAGHKTRQFAVRQGKVDWQVWIDEGASPLPRKLVLTANNDPARPQYVATLAWNTAPALSPATFAFKAPADASRIGIVPAVAATQEATP
jgi:hypothetical protein